LRTLWLGLFTAAECEIMPASNAVHDLLALAQEPSSEKRRELLHAVTDLFLSTDQHEAATTEMFGSVMGSVCDGVSEEDRADPRCTACAGDLRATRACQQAGA
jgi:hypothetical protein